MNGSNVLTQEQLSPFVQLIEERIGLSFDDLCWKDIMRAVQAGMDKHGESQEKFFRRLIISQKEMQHFIDRVTITETYFFREEKQFLQLKKLLSTMSKKKLVCWSVTTATGEEAYSLAMLLEEYYSGEYIVYATDINQQALATFDLSCYRKRSVRTDGASFHNLLDKYGSWEEGCWSPADRIKKNIYSTQLNIIDGKFSFIPDDTDIVFFRNTLIYMNLSTKRMVLEQIMAKMSQGGLLFLGSSEVPLIELPYLALQHDIDNGFYFVKRAAKESVESCMDYIKESDDLTIDPQAGKKGIKTGCEGCSTNQACLDQAFLKINESSLVEAEAHINYYVEQHGPSALTCYLSGQVAYYGDDQSQAEACFNESIQRDVAFWPAYYRLGQLYHQRFPQQSLNQFATCRSILEKEKDDKRAKLCFLFGDFNLTYILKLCEGWEKKLCEKLDKDMLR